MNKSIRFRFFAWLSTQTLLIFLAVGLVLFLFNLHEQREHPLLQEEEAEEALLVAGFMVMLFPLALGSAWIITRRLLRPWQLLAVQAERIAAGQLQERIHVIEPNDEIGRVATILNTAFDRYEDALERMHRFSYDVAHQLRNPLAAIRTSGEVCLTQTRDAEEYESVIGGILENSQRLNRTVEQLLMLARVSNRISNDLMGDVPLHEVAQAVVEEARIIGESNEVVVNLEIEQGPYIVRGIEELIREALANVLDNALGVSPEGARIDVNVQSMPNGWVRIAISDMGPGVSVEDRLELFRPFRQGAGHGQGVGLGLAIAADVCSAHGGEIGVDSRDGGGSIFWLSFPGANVNRH